jgi:asparagine synthase (glutamine-hydrolysing)
MKVESLFLSEPMIKLAFSIPWQQKYNPKTNTGKIPLRNLLAKYEKQSPPTTKKGFSLNLVKMWNSYGRKKVALYLNTDAEVVKNKLINYAWIEKSMRGLQSQSLEMSPRYINKMLMILALEVWYRLFVSKTLKISEKL